MELSTFNRLEDSTPRVNLGILKIQKNVFLSVIKIPPKSHGVSKSNILQTATSHSTRNLTSENMGPPYQALPTQRCLRPADLECACVLVGPLAPAGVTLPPTPRRSLLTRRKAHPTCLAEVTRAKGIEHRSRSEG